MRNIQVTFNGKVVFPKDVYPTAGTHLVGEIDASYENLVNTFGEPNADGDDYKSDANWTIHTPDGVSTIYNWKDGLNYNQHEGMGGLPVEEIKHWHIGGHSKRVVSYIEKALGINQ